MTQDPLLGVVLVVRQASSQAQVVLRIGLAESPGSVFNIGPVEFAKFAMPASWLMNRKLDFEIGNCGPSIAARSGITTASDLRFVSFPCDCVSLNEYEENREKPISLVTAFNIVFILDSRLVTDDLAELYWQCISTLSRAIIQEEERCYFLSLQGEKLMDQASALVSNLYSLFQTAYDGLSSIERGVSLYVNDSILTHIGVIPFSSAPPPPQGYQSLLLTCDADTLQTRLPVDSASNVRRLIDATDPTKTIKEHMIELGLPVSTIQRISQHLVYWKKAKIVPTLNKRTVLILNPSLDHIAPSADLLSRFASRYNIRSHSIARSIWFTLLNMFSNGQSLSEIKESVLSEIPQLQSKFSDVCTFFLSHQILTFSESFYRYFPGGGGQPAKRIPGRPKFQNQLPPEIRSQFSPFEFDVIFEKLQFNTIGAEMMIRFISHYVKQHKDLMTARIELNERFRYTNDDFHKFTECLVGHHMDSLLVKYECDV